MGGWPNQQIRIPLPSAIIFSPSFEIKSIYTNKLSFNFISNLGMANFFDIEEYPLRKVSTRLPQYCTEPPVSTLSHTTRHESETSRKLTMISKLILMHLESDSYLPEDHRKHIRSLTNRNNKEQFVEERLRNKIIKLNQTTLRWWRQRIVILDGLLFWNGCWD